MIRFGSWSTLLLVFALQMILLAGLLLRVRENRRANFYLGALLIVITGLLTPFILGYAGFYDAYPWLTFAPFAVPLAVGPLVYGHVVALSRDRPLSRLHWVPPLIQFAYQLVLFCLPLETRWWFDENVQSPLLSPILSLAVLASMAGYCWAAWRALRDYRAWLEARRRQTGPAKRIRLILVLMIVLVAARAGYEAFDRLVRPVDYFDLFGFYILLALIGTALGIEGWRNARSPSPAIEETPGRDWRKQGEDWLAATREAGWWRDPDLSVADLARRLGTNSTHLTRALTEAGGGFATAINAIRAEAVAERISANDRMDLLSLAYESGFGSKASFNRAFRTRFGSTPSSYRLARSDAAEVAKPT